MKKQLPKVNRELAEKLREQSHDPAMKKSKQREAAALLADPRFAAMFERPEFQVDPESNEYKLLNPLVSQLDKVRSFLLSVRTRPFAIHKRRVSDPTENRSSLGSSCCLSVLSFPSRIEHETFWQGIHPRNVHCSRRRQFSLVSYNLEIEERGLQTQGDKRPSHSLVCCCTSFWLWG